MQRITLNKSGALFVSLALFTLTHQSGHADVTDDSKAILKQMSGALAGAKTLKAKGNRTIDPKLIGAKAIKEEAEFEVVVQRPGNIYSQSRNEESTRNLYFDGTSLTITDKSDVGLFYASAPLKADSVEAFSGELIKRFGYQPPMAEFFTSDPYPLLLEEVKTGKIAGEDTIADVPCQHLAFEQEGLSWDVWVAEKDHLPRKFVITFLDIEGSPKIEVTMASWELDAAVSDTRFSWKAPEDAVELGLIPAAPTEEEQADEEDEEDEEEE